MAAIVRWAAVASAVLRSPSEHDAIAALSSYLMQTTSLDHEALSVVIEQHIDREAAEIMKTTAARLRSEGRQEGRIEGHAEGHTEGSAETLLRLIAQRFGPVDDAVAHRVRTAPPAELDRWTDRILSAPTLDELFARG